MSYFEVASSEAQSAAGWLAGGPAGGRAAAAGHAFVARDREESRPARLPVPSRPVRRLRFAPFRPFPVDELSLSWTLSARSAAAASSAGRHDAHSALGLSLPN